MIFLLFFFQAEDGIRDLVRSRGLGDVYKRQALAHPQEVGREPARLAGGSVGRIHRPQVRAAVERRVADVVVVADVACLLYTSDAADELLCVDLGGRRIIKKKKHTSLKC